MSNSSDVKKWIPADNIKLEKAAERAVFSETNLLVTAGPGAGKTELLAQRACYLLQTGVSGSPKKILAISFKVDSATNLEKRVLKRVGRELSQRFESRTYDSFAKHLLDHFRKGLEEDYCPDQDYTIITTKEELKELVVANFRDKYPIQKITKYGDLLCMLAKDQLPRKNTNNNNVYDTLVNELWTVMPKGSGNFISTLTFPMITRLVEYLVKTNVYIKNALRTTYSHVFLDEFQDTTYFQYDLLREIFLNSNAVITAVGDKKQRIMGWAGALDNAFEDFKKDFNASEEQLIRNHRSVPYLIDIQNYLAKDLDPNVEIVEAPIKSSNDKGECLVWKFAEHYKEAIYLSNQIEKWLKNDGITPRDICILVKQQEDIYAEALMLELKKRNINARVEKEYQELLSEDCIALLIHMLKLIVTHRAPESWQYVFGTLMHLNCYNEEDTKKIYELDSLLSSFIEKLKSELVKVSSPKLLDIFLFDMLNFFGFEKYISVNPQYKGGNYLNKLVKNFSKKIASSYRIFRDWEQSLYDFIGEGTIPVMTIHKSKGLEYNTVIFIGLEDAAFWNFLNQSEEDKRAFFVAFSRAKERVIFTFSDKRIIKHYDELKNMPQNSTNISEIYTNLKQAGVDIIDIVNV